MDFDKAVAAFTRKKKGQNLADEKREAYRKMVNEYTSLKYGQVVNGNRREREITQELIERREEKAKAASVDIADDLASFIDLDLGAPKGNGVDLEMGKPKKGRK